MYVTSALILNFTTIWLLVEYDDADGVDAFRLGINTDTGDYVGFPSEQFHVDGITPVQRATGEPVDWFRWADCADLDNNPIEPGHRTH